MFWGLSEALDLYYEYLNAFKDVPVREQSPGEEGEQQKEGTDTPLPDEIPIANDLLSTPTTPSEAGSPGDTLNILLFGSCDPRHIVKTMAKTYKHRAANAKMPLLHFYVVDASVEHVARHLALLAIALEHPEALMLRQKVHLFMDVYGNTLLRPYSQQYLMAKTKTLGAQSQLQQLAPFIELDSLRFRERDGVYNAFDFWQLREANAFDVKDSWERRLRASLGGRYDHRDGVFDWDLCMVLKSNGADQLCSQEYRYWRDTGIAFTYPQYEQCVANRTLACDLRRNGQTISHRGYVGDMTTGPFAAFGLKSDDSRMTRSAHGTNDFRATDVTERNLLELFHELETGTPYVHNMETSRKYGSVLLQMGKVLAEVGSGEDGAPHAGKYGMPWIDVGGVKVTFLSVEALTQLQTPATQWRKFFDICQVGSMYFQILKEDFLEVMRDKSLLLLETRLWTVQARKEVGEFEKRLKDFVRDKGYKGVINYQAVNGKYSVLKFKRNPTIA